MAALGAKIEQKQIEFDVLSERVLNYDKAKDELSNLEIELDTCYRNIRLPRTREIYDLQRHIKPKLGRAGCKEIEATCQNGALPAALRGGTTIIG